MLTLSPGEILRLQRAMRVLLSPLEYREIDQWRGHVNDEVRDLLNADSAGFLLPIPGLAPMFSREHAPEVLAPFPGLLPPALSDGTPIWHRMLSLGVASLQDGYGADLPRYLKSEYYNEFAVPGGAAETVACAFAIEDGDGTPRGAASLHLWNTRRGKRQFAEREVALLSLLSPSFQAGVESLLRFGMYRERLLRDIDALGMAVVVCDASGRPMHETPEAVHLLADDPEADIVRALIADMVAPRDTNLCLARLAPREVTTTAARYRLSACMHSGAGFSGLTLVSMLRRTPRWLSAAELRARFGLTPTEARVSHLLAAGLRNAEIAGKLGASQHTARRHTERVLKKLGIRSRAQVVASITS